MRFWLLSQLERSHYYANLPKKNKVISEYLAKLVGLNHWSCFLVLLWRLQ